jgi:hypothetical protein
MEIEDVFPAVIAHRANRIDIEAPVAAVRRKDFGAVLRRLPEQDGGE